MYARAEFGDNVVEDVAVGRSVLAPQPPKEKNFIHRAKESLQLLRWGDLFPFEKFSFIARLLRDDGFDRSEHFKLMMIINFGTDESAQSPATDDHSIFFEAPERFPNRYKAHAVVFRKLNFGGKATRLRELPRQDLGAQTLFNLIPKGQLTIPHGRRWQ